MPADSLAPQGRSFGRYIVHHELARGDRATVHFGRSLAQGEGEGCGTVAIKRFHPAYACDPSFVSRLLGEARLAAHVQHPSVLTPLDVVAVEGRELLVVTQYLEGESLARLIRAAGRSNPVRPEIAVSVLLGVLAGLHAAHEASRERGEP